MMNKRYWLPMVLGALAALFLLAACESERVEVTPLPSATSEEQAEVQATETPEEATATSAPTATMTATAVPQPTDTPPPTEAAQPAAAPTEVIPKDLVICMPEEPASLYWYSESSPAARAVQHAFLENDITTLSFSYQAHGLEKLPNLEDGDAAIEDVEVNEGDIVIDSSGTPTELAEGVTVFNTEGEEETFAGEPIVMEQMVVDFTLQPRVWSDGEPVTAVDSVYSYELAREAAATSKVKINRTAAYEAVDDLTVRWTSVPGFIDAAYFLNFWRPLPRHAWQGLTEAELQVLDVSSRTPIGDGPFKIVAWTEGDSIRLEPNEFYYLADEGLPYLDSVTFRFMPESNDLIADLLAEKCHIVTQDGLTMADGSFLLEAEMNGLLVPYFQVDPLFEHIDFGINSYRYGDDVNPQNEDWRPDWFEDVRVRQAVTMCTDRQEMIDEVLYGRSEILHTYVPAMHPLYPEEITRLRFDVEAANDLLDEVGYRDSDRDGWREDPESETPFQVTLLTTEENEMRRQIAEMFKDDMVECGIDVEISYLPTEDLFADGPDGPLFGRQFDLAEYAWESDIEPPCYLYADFSIPGPPESINPLTEMPYPFGWRGRNVLGWVDAGFSSACDSGLNSILLTDNFTRNHEKALSLFSEETPSLLLFPRLKIGVARPEVVNFSIDPTEPSELFNLYQIDLAR